jgi:heme-degrading monooxygenase HmoA
VAIDLSKSQCPLCHFASEGRLPRFAHGGTADPSRDQVLDSRPMSACEAGVGMNRPTEGRIPNRNLLMTRPQGPATGERLVTGDTSFSPAFLKETVYMDEARARIAETPVPPFVAVIFTSLRTPDDNGYGETAVAMERLVRQQAGFLGVESAREELGITVSYWQNEDAARSWKQVAEHLVAQRQGRDSWYRDYQVRVATVIRDYGPADSDLAE